MRRWLDWILRYRLLSVVGSAMALVSLSFYSSYSDRPILGRWSYEFTGFMALMWLGWLFYLRRTARGPNLGQWGRSRSRRVSEIAWEAAVFSWGLAYLLSALDTPTAAARVLDANLLGSITPGAAVLEWAAMAAMLVVFAGFMVSHKHSRWINLMLPVLGVGALFVVGEGFYRAKAILCPSVQGFPTYSSTLWVRRFGHRNDMGFRDENHVLAKPDTVQRLLVIGDSFAFGWGIRQMADRFGELVAKALLDSTDSPWESLNASRGDSNTMDEIAFLRTMIPYRPDVVVLLYTFNDIDYLQPVTLRSLLTESPESYWARIHPLRVAFENSYFFQEVWVRSRLILSQFHGYVSPADPYSDTKLLERHMMDLAKFTSLAEAAGAVVGIVPFDIGVRANEAIRTRYLTFVESAERAGLPVWSLEGAFDEFPFHALTVNALDRHPNERANALAANEVASRLAAQLESPGENGR